MTKRWQQPLKITFSPDDEQIKHVIVVATAVYLNTLLTEVITAL